MRWYVQNFVGRYFYERTHFEADDQCQKHQLGLNYRSGGKKLGPLKSGTDRKFSDLPNGLQPIDAVSVFFFLSPSPSLLLRLFLSMKEIKNKLSTL